MLKLVFLGFLLNEVQLIKWLALKFRRKYLFLWFSCDILLDTDEVIRVPHHLLDFPVPEEMESSVCNSGEHPAQFWYRKLPCGLEFFHTSSHKPFLPSSGLIPTDEKLWKRTGYYPCLAFFILVFLYLMETVALLPKNMQIYRMNRR